MVNIGPSLNSCLKHLKISGPLGRYHYIATVANDGHEKVERKGLGHLDTLSDDSFGVVF